MDRIKGNIEMENLSELLKNAPTDDGTFYGSIYDLFVLIGITKGVNEINQGKGTPIEEFIQEREALYESYNRRFG